jgi:hypothetical protein
MILNAYGVLDAFLSFLRLGLGLLVLWLAFSAWRLWTRCRSLPESRQILEDRCYLLFLLAGLLLALNVISWPVFYLLLQSYVPEVGGVMCIYGVTRIGTDSIGPSRFLPPLVTTLQVTKPALVWLSGAWFVLYLINRATRTAPLTGRVLVLLMLAGLLGVADAAVECIYLALPMREEFLSSGCCTTVFDGPTRVTGFLVEDRAVPWLYAAYYAVNGGMVLALAIAAWRYPRPFERWLLPLLLVALVSLAINGIFLIEVAAPRLLHLPYHHCPYDLVPDAPESLVGVALFVAGCFCVGWACVAAWLGNVGEALPLSRAKAAALLHFGFLAYLGSLAMMSVELALA